MRIGLRRTSSTIDGWPRAAAARSGSPVIITIRSVGRRASGRAASSIPVIPGISISVTTTAGRTRPSATSRRASRPPAATATSQPARVRARATKARMAGSSSTTRTTRPPARLGRRRRSRRPVRRVLAHRRSIPPCPRRIPLPPPMWRAVHARTVARLRPLGRMTYRSTAWSPPCSGRIGRGGFAEMRLELVERCQLEIRVGSSHRDRSTATGIPPAGSSTRPCASQRRSRRRHRPPSHRRRGGSIPGPGSRARRVRLRRSRAAA